MASLEAILKNIEININNILYALCFLLIVYTISSVVRFHKYNREDELNSNKSVRKYIIVPGLACIYSLVISCCLGVINNIPKGLSDICGVVFMFIYYYFFIRLIMFSTDDSDGNIEHFDDLSGAFIYITSTMSPRILLFINVVGILVAYILYKKNENEDFVHWIRSRVIIIIETALAVIITSKINPDSFIGVLWLNVGIISIFTIILPLINEKLLDYYEEHI